MNDFFLISEWVLFKQYFHYNMVKPPIAFS